MIRLTIAADTIDKAVIERAVDVLYHGGIVAYPTETFYGLAVDPRRDDAVGRLYDAKGRSASIAIPLIAASLAQAQEAAIFGDSEHRLARAFWPGPLTIVMPPREAIAPRTLGDGATVALRVPSHVVARELAGRFGFCITATSANRSGEPPANEAEQVAGQFSGSDLVDLLLDGGPTPGGPPSTIVEMAGTAPRCVRAGAVAWDRVLRSLE